MIINRKFTFKNRTTEENERFLDLLTTAEDILSQATRNITYSSFPQLNKWMIEELQGIIDNISKIEYSLSANHASILKPVAVVDKTRYYELHYFHGRKNTGFIYIKTELNIADYADEDSFLLALVDKKELDSLEIDNITNINEIDRATYYARREIRTTEEYHEME